MRGINEQQSDVNKVTPLRSMAIMVGVFWALLFAFRLRAEAQQLAKIPKIGIFSAGAGSGSGIELFKRDLAALVTLRGRT